MQYGSAKAPHTDFYAGFAKVPVAGRVRRRDPGIEMGSHHWVVFYAYRQAPAEPAYRRNVRCGYCLRRGTSYQKKILPFSIAPRRRRRGPPAGACGGLRPLRGAFWGSFSLDIFETFLRIRVLLSPFFCPFSPLFSPLFPLSLPLRTRPCSDDAVMAR